MSEETKVYEGPYSETEGKKVEMDLYNAAHGKVPRTGGPYMDDLAAVEAEKIRAEREDREPDLDNPPATVATVLVPKHELVERDTDKSHYSEHVPVENEPVGKVVVDTSGGFYVEPDPGQADWDNDETKLHALQAGNLLREEKEKAAAQTPPSEESETTDEDEQ